MIFKVREGKFSGPSQYAKFLFSFVLNLFSNIINDDSSLRLIIQGICTSRIRSYHHCVEVVLDFSVYLSNFAG